MLAVAVLAGAVAVAVAAVAVALAVAVAVAVVAVVAVRLVGVTAPSLAALTAAPALLLGVLLLGSFVGGIGCAAVGKDAAARECEDGVGAAAVLVRGVGFGRSPRLSERQQCSHRVSRLAPKEKARCKDKERRGM